MVLCPIMSTVSICKTFSPVNPGFQSQNSFFIVKIALFLVFFAIIFMYRLKQKGKIHPLLIPKTLVEQYYETGLYLES